MLNQIETLSHFKPEDITSTSDFPIEWMAEALPYRRGYGAGRILNMGAGNNDAKVRQMYSYGFDTMSVDINPTAMESLSEKGWFATTNDATQLGSGEMFWWAPGIIEHFDGILLQALLPSLLGDTWKLALEAADVALHPDGHMFFTMYLAADEVYEDLINHEYSRAMWRENAARWKHRYDLNYDTFQRHGLNFPYHAFAVGKPGPMKEEYDWTSNSRLLSDYYFLRDSNLFDPVFERFSQHTDMWEYERFMIQDLGYILRRKELVARPSRTSGVISPGANYWWQKPQYFRYRPWYQDLNVRDPDYFDKAKVRRHKISPRSAYYLEVYARKLLSRLPRSQRAAFKKWYQGDASNGFPI